MPSTRPGDYRLAGDLVWPGTAGSFLSQALVAAAEDRYDEVEAAFQRAADTSEQHGMLYDQAQVLYE